MNYSNFLKITAATALGIGIIACGGDSDDGREGGFVFNNDDPSTFRQIERHAAVEAGTVGIEAEAGLGIAPVRDAYNASNPQEDAEGRWLGEITDSVNLLHSALDDDLRAAGLAPASTETSLAQAGPVIVPDVIRFNPDQPASYPNGRELTDQVVDLTLAAVLLDLGVEGQNLRTLADLPLNPPTNDRDFTSTFPYLASPN